MSDNLKKILSAASIPNETLDEQMERMSIPDSYSDAMVISKLVEIYKGNPQLNGTSENIISRLSGTNVVTQEDAPVKAEAKSSVDESKIKDSTTTNKEKIMPQNNELNLDIDGALGANVDMQNLKANAAANQGAAPAEAKSRATKVIKLEAGAEDLKQKAMAAVQQNRTSGYKVTNCYAKKASKKTLVEDYAKGNRKPIYANGHAVNGIVGYLVKPGRNGVVDSTALTTAVNNILNDIRAKFGWDDASRTCKNPAYNVAIGELVDKLTAASQIVTDSVREAHMPANAKPGDCVILAGNTSFLVNEDKLSNKLSIQGEKLSTGDIYVSSKLSEKMFKDLLPMITYSGSPLTIFEAGARKVQNSKGETKFSYFLQVKGRDAIKDIAVANNLVAGKTAYIKAEAKIDNLVYETTSNTGKPVKKVFKIMLYVPVYGQVQHVASVNCPELYLKENKKEASGSKATTKDYFNDKEYLENKYNKFANSLKEINL